jgi:formylglycine-generating enzyme required for sulfatase activity
MKRVVFSLIFSAIFALPLAGAWIFPATASGRPQTHTNSIGMELVLIPAGSFELDLDIVNNFKEVLYRPKMIISKPFYLGKYEVTQEQWVAVMGSGTNPSNFPGRTNPVEQVSWEDVQVFIKLLNQKEGHNRYRLPTEAEWEYAARGGQDVKRTYFFMDNPKTWDEKTWDEAASALDAYAWFDKNSGNTTHPVGQKKPNPYGLYDIYGNVWEWVQDRYAQDLPTAKEVRDYRGPAKGSDRVERGGSWIDPVVNCRSSARLHDALGFRYNFIGFRLALSPE